MSLREDYSGACTGGFHDDMATVFQAGADYVGTAASPGAAYAGLSNGLAEASAKGLKLFTITESVAFEPDNLKLGGVHQQTFFAGIIDALAHEGIYSQYVGLSLNTSDTLDTKIDFTFSM